jgi:hypothetical protein
MPNVEYRITKLCDLRIVTSQEPGKAEAATAIELDREHLIPSARFWHSIFHRYGLTERVFKYFRYAEVFSRVVAANPTDRVRFCIDRRAAVVDPAKPDVPGLPIPGLLLAASNPTKPLITYDQTMELINRYNGTDVSCRGGIATSRHAPRSGDRGFNIGPDLFHNRFDVQVPIDGYGQPRLYLSLLRQICTNGAVGYHRAFRSDIRIGEDAAWTLERALLQFDHDEGFAAIRQRFEAAQNSWASVHETLRLQNVLKSVKQKHVVPGQPGGIPVNRRVDLGRRSLPAELNRVAGDLNALYGLTNLDSLSVKRQRILPAKCRVYDLINFASEVATHHIVAGTQGGLQGYIGTLIADEYDLEGTAEKVPEFRDLFLNAN